MIFKGVLLLFIPIIGILMVFGIWWFVSKFIDWLFS